VPEPGIIPLAVPGEGNPPSLATMTRRPLLMSPVFGGRRKARSTDHAVIHATEIGEDGKGTRGRGIVEEIEVR